MNTNHHSTASRSHFTVGIDLGTTNCAVAYVNNAAGGEGAIEVFQTLQLVSEGNLSPLPMLPSYLYLAGMHELVQENIRLPWDDKTASVVGELAKKLGASVPSRLVSSAKSWLCHAGVDRKAAILPWSGARDLEKLSPVEASSRYLQHIRDAWNYQMAQGNPEYQLQNQEVILTVPASFDEIARELTLEAAQKAGFAKITLLEEPQAAFYAWIAVNRDSWHRYLHNGQIVVICDMGGGTTDFSLITVQEEGGKPVFTRVAVGDHLILGGDNIDMALARHIEVKLTGQAGKLDSGQWSMLCHGCRRAKEELLTEGRRLRSFPVVVQDRSSRLIGSTLKYELTEEEVREIVQNGFFPITRLEEDPVKSSRMGLQEWGLPYVQDTAVSRHLASFLRKHQASIRDLREKTGQPSADLARPDAILFNGGALKPKFLQDRIVRIMESWFSLDHGAEKVSEGDATGKGFRPLVLSHEMGDLSVAYGAAYYGRVRRGKGIRISGGIGRSYYVGIGTEKKEGAGGAAAGSPQALCLVPRKMEEGQEIEVRDREFILLIGEPVSFPLYTSSTRLLDQVGDILPVNLETGEESLTPLPPIQTILRRGRAKLTKVPVHLRARLTEIGTLELWCVSREGDRQWKLQFGIREEGKSKPVSSLVEDQEPAAEEGEALDVERIRPLFSSAFNIDSGELPSGLGKVTPDNLLKKMEEVLETPRQAWPIFTLRTMGEMLIDLSGLSGLSGHKGRSAVQEARWLNLVGFCLRPGLGYPLDEWRIKNLLKTVSQGMKEVKDREIRTQLWILYRRVAGGLNQNQQTEVFRRISPYLLPQKKAPSGPKPSPHELAEIWRLAASLERLDETSKEALGNAVLDRLVRGKPLGADLWALARIGARQPLYGSVHAVVAAELVEEWIIRLMETKGLPQNEEIFTLTQLARKTPDRARNISDAVRNRVIGFLSLAREEASSGHGRKSDLAALDQAIQSIREVSHYQTREQSLVFGESLPRGLQLVSAGED